MKLLRVLLALALLSAPVGAGERLRIRVSHNEGLAPANLLIQAIVEPAAANRMLEVVADSDEFYRSSTIQLDGEHGPRVSRIWFQRLPAGLYEVSVRVLASDGKEIACERDSLIIG